MMKPILRFNNEKLLCDLYKENILTKKVKAVHKNGVISLNTRYYVSGNKPK